MKRFNKTAVALATAGAMTLAIVPNASAQNVPPAPLPAETGAGTKDEGHADSIDDLLKDPNAEGELGEDLQRQEDEKGYKQTEADGTEAKPGEVFGQQGGGTVAGDYETNVDGMRPANPDELKPEDVFKEDGTVDKDKLKKVLIGVGAAAGLLTIAGIVYKIVKNSKGEPVLVPADRADQTPTAADEAKTEELLENNAAEIAAQAGAAEATTGDAATADRGVGAATGNNTIAKGLVGLLIASIMGAAAFAFGRRRLV